MEEMTSGKFSKINLWGLSMTHFTRSNDLFKSHQILHRIINLFCTVTKI